jgi:hypothetical protein
MGGRFWLTVIGSVIGLCIAGFLFFTLFAKAWEAWGALAAMIVALLLVVGIAYVADRRVTRNREY